MGIKADYEKAKADYKYLVSHHNDEPADLSGVFDDGEYYKKLLDNPCKSEAYDHFLSLIIYTATAGFASTSSDHNEHTIPDFTDDRVCSIFTEYSLEDEVLAKWGVDLSGADHGKS